MLHFKFLTGDVNWRKYGAKFVSRRLNNGDWDYWLVLEVINLPDAAGRAADSTYLVQLSAISPEAAGKEKLDSAFASCGFSNDVDESDPLIQVEALYDYGISAHLWHSEGNNLRVLLREAHRQADGIHCLFGFYMDRPENRIGQSGWDLISGQDVREFLARRE